MYKRGGSLQYELALETRRERNNCQLCACLTDVVPQRFFCQRVILATEWNFKASQLIVAGKVYFYEYGTEKLYLDALCIQTTSMKNN